MSQAKCLITGCNHPRAAALRGLCMVCYGRAKKMVEAGETTWEKLAQLGLCEGKESNPFDDAYTRATEGQ